MAISDSRTGIDRRFQRSPYASAYPWHSSAGPIRASPVAHRHCLCMPPPFTPPGDQVLAPICFPDLVSLRPSNTGSALRFPRLCQQYSPGTLYDAYGRSFSYGLQVCLAARADYESAVLPATGGRMIRWLRVSPECLKHGPFIHHTGRPSLLATLSQRFETVCYQPPRLPGYLPEMGNW